MMVAAAAPGGGRSCDWWTGSCKREAIFEKQRAEVRERWKAHFMRLTEGGASNDNRTDAGPAAEEVPGG